MVLGQDRAEACQASRVLLGVFLLSSRWLLFLDGECCREHLNPKASTSLCTYVEILLLTRKLACDSLLLGVCASEINVILLG